MRSNMAAVNADPATSVRSRTKEAKVSLSSAQSSSDYVMSSSSTRQHLFFLLLLLLITNSLHLLLQVTSISFNYTRFDGGNIIEDARSCPEGIHKICLKEDATQLDADHSIQFTNASSSSGYAVYSEALPLWKWEEGNNNNNNSTAAKVTTNFTTRFSINLINRNQSCNVTGGLAFFLSHHPHRIPPEHQASMLGLVSERHKTSASEDSSFIAVEVDTFPDDLWDPPYVHVGIDVNSIKSKEVGNLGALANEGDGNIIGEVQVDYDSSTGNLTATVQHMDRVYAQISYPVDLSGTLPQLAAIGVSSTTWFCSRHNKVSSWSFDSTWDRVLPERKDNKNLVVVLMVAIVVGLVLVLVSLGLLLRWRARRVMVREVDGGDLEEDSDSSVINEEAFTDTGGPRRLEYNDLVAATGHFDEKRKLGAGASVTVYRGFLRELNLEAAIKRVSGGGDSKRRRKEYMAEVNVISRLRHRNLVQLIGWCNQKGEFLLAYEFMPNLSLDSHLFGRADGKHSLTSWPARWNIALGIASALLYLHEEGDHCVVHRDVKCSNVMLDENFNAKLGDFGLARLTDHGRGLQTTMLGGTLGYMAPECFYTRKASIESDVYAFGVVALEIATGRRAIKGGVKKEGKQPVRLVEWVWDLFAKGDILEAADGRLDIDSVDQRQMEILLVVGLWCAHPDDRRRPSIRKAMAALNLEDVNVDLPREMPVAVYALPERHGEETSQPSSSLGNYAVSSFYYQGR